MTCRAGRGSGQAGRTGFDVHEVPPAASVRRGGSCSEQSRGLRRVGRLEAMRRPPSRLAVILALTSLAACTTVHIHNSDGSLSTSQGFGILSVAIPRNPSGLLVDARGVGLLRIGDSLSLGYVEQKMAFLTDECRVVFWIESAEQAEAVTRLVGNVDAMCMVGPGSTDKPQ